MAGSRGSFPAGSTLYLDLAIFQNKKHEVEIELSVMSVKGGGGSPLDPPGVKSLPSFHEQLW